MSRRPALNKVAPSWTVKRLIHIVQAPSTSLPPPSLEVDGSSSSQFVKNIPDIAASSATSPLVGAQRK